MSVSEKMKGNTNAEVWTLDKATEFCDSVLDFVIDNPKSRSLSEACTELGYYEELISYLSNKFNTEFKSIKRAKDIVKNRLVSQGLDGEANSTMAIFILKNNHNMKDRHDVTSGEKPMTQSIPVVLQDGRTYEDLKNDLQPE